MNKLWSVETIDVNNELLRYRLFSSYDRALEYAEDMRVSMPYRIWIVKMVNVDDSVVKPYAQGA